MRKLVHSAHMDQMELEKSQKEAQNLPMQSMVIREEWNFQFEPLVYPKHITEEIQHLRRKIVKMPFIPFWAENSAPKQYPNFLSFMEQIFELLKSSWSHSHLDQFKTH